MNNTARLAELQKADGGYFRDRICAELAYAIRLSETGGGKHNGLIADAIAGIEKALAAEGSVTRSAVLSAEDALKPMGKDCKKLKIRPIAHAHIDMNWMWRYDETVSITLETLRTVLRLMDEYDFFTFGQSQASVYEIIEKFEPEMLDEIRKRIKEGRWEATATTWVEADKNMPTGEAFARHYLYTKKYLTGLLGLGEEDFLLDYEPDTFGHNANTPEFLANAGVKYYYHCRGQKEHEIYRWRSASGAELLVYCDTFWYGGDVNAHTAAMLPDFSKRNNVDEMLMVYGVGDHGGGPTRRDLERISDMMGWPIYPEIKCGTYRDYFAQIEKNKNKLPVIDRELNFVFTGCYTTQTKIKKYDSICTKILGETELYSAVAQNYVKGYSGKNLEEYWRHVLFSHFHDILTGSGVDATREYASAMYQITLAGANTEKARAMRAISDAIDTASLLPDEICGDSNAEGAGAGYGINYGLKPGVLEYQVSQAERGNGLRRVYHLFNPGEAYAGLTEITLWDWKGDSSFISASLPDGTAIDAQVLTKGRDNFCGHDYIRVLVDAGIPAYGWQTVVIDQDIQPEVMQMGMIWHRFHEPFTYKLENDALRVDIDSRSGDVKKMVDKVTGEVLCENAGLRYTLESSEAGMSSWITGRFMGESKAMAADLFEWESENGKLCQILKVSGLVGERSRATVRYKLSRGSGMLAVETETDWVEIGPKAGKMPNLSFVVPLGYETENYRCDIQFGTVDRESRADDMPAISFVCGLNEGRKKKVMLTVEGKHGFRGFDDAISVALLRSSNTPDLYPEYGVFKTRMALSCEGDSTPAKLIASSRGYMNTPSVISGMRHKGVLKPQGSFMKTEGGVVSALKESEDKKSLVLRVYEPDGKNAQFAACFDRKVKSAVFCDFHEKRIAPKKTKADAGPAIDGKTVTFGLKKNTVASVLIEFA